MRKRRGGGGGGGGFVSQCSKIVCAHMHLSVTGLPADCLSACIVRHASVYMYIA